MLAMALLCVLSAAPAVNVIGFVIRPSLLHSRHEYLAPRMWMSLLVAACASHRAGGSDGWVTSS